MPLNGAERSGPSSIERGTPFAHAPATRNAVRGNVDGDTREVDMQRLWRRAREIRTTFTNLWSTARGAICAGGVVGSPRKRGASRAGVAREGAARDAPDAPEAPPPRRKGAAAPQNWRLASIEGRSGGAGLRCAAGAAGGARTPGVPAASRRAATPWPPSRASTGKPVVPAASQSGCGPGLRPPAVAAPGDR